MEKVVVKVEDKSLLELSDKLVGYRMLVDDLAVMLAKTSREFWSKATELYQLDPEKKRYHYGHYAREIMEE